MSVIVPNSITGAGTLTKRRRGGWQAQLKGHVRPRRVLVEHSSSEQRPHCLTSHASRASTVRP